MKRSLKRALFAGAVVIAAVIGLQGPALAHDVRYPIETFWTSYGAVTVYYYPGSGTHGHVMVCDGRSDGITVWAEFYYRLPGHFDDIYGSVSDPDGNGGSCGDWYAPSGGNVTSVNGHAGSVSTGWKST